ncbi:transposase, partial [Streptococcus sp. ZJ93]
MSKRSPKSVEEKLEIVCLLLHQEQSLTQLSKHYQVDHQTIQSWKMKYEEFGIDGLKESRTWKHYSSELKEQAVQDYLAGKGSLRDICSNYHISDPYVLRSWIKRYTSGKELTSTSKGYSRMNKGRKTTFEERLEIVTFTIAHEKDYQAAIEKFDISYQQVYSWVRKFENEGAQGLVDRRGKGLESKPN